MTPRALLILALVALVAGIVVGLVLRRAVDSESSKSGSEKLGARLRRMARRQAMNLFLRRWRTEDRGGGRKRGDEDERK